MAIPGKELFAQRVKQLEGFGHRGSATEAERKAADYLCAELHQLGIQAVQEPFPGYSSFGARILLHVIVAAAGMAVVGIYPILTIITGLVVIISFVGESGTRFLGLSRLLPHAQSRNVTGTIPPADGSKPLRQLIVCAHIDSQRTGWFWQTPVLKVLSALLQKVPAPMQSPTFPIMAAFVLQPVAGVAALLWPLHFPVILCLSIFMFIYGLAALILGNWARGAFVPGACDNASGVAAAMALAEQWLKEPVAGVQLVLLLSGCEETGSLGAAAWLQAHRAELAQIPSYFLVLDSLGYGAPRFLKREYTLATVPLPYKPEMLKLADQVALQQGLTKAGPHILPTFTDALAFIQRGIPGVSVITCEDGVYLPNYHQMTDTSDNMNFDVGWQATTYAWGLLKALATVR